MKTDTFDYYKEFFDNDKEAILLIKDNYIVDANKAAMKLYEINSKEDFKVIHPSQLSAKYQNDGQSSYEKANKMIKTCYKKGNKSFIWLAKSLKGKEFLVEVNLRVIKLNKEKLIYSNVKKIQKEAKLLKEKTSIINDIKNLIQTKEEKDIIDKLNLFEEYKRVLDESSIVSKADLSGKITFVNNNFCKISGYSKKELLGANHNIVKHPDMPSIAFKNMWQTIKSKKVYKGIIKNINKQNETYYVDTTIMPILDKEDNIVEYISVRHDVTNLYKKDEIISRQNTDNLTKLPNRIRLLEDIRNTINPKLAILNVDRFRGINESYSLEMGDKLLISISKILKETEGTNISVYKIPGDVFAILGVGNIHIERLVSICKLIIHRFKTKAVLIDNVNLEISVTIGISTNEEKLLPYAELALQYAKKNHLNYAIFDEELPIYQELLKSIETTKEIKKAIKNDKVLVYGQKIVSNIDNEIKYETLMRIELENGDILSPFFFLEQAKKAKLYPYLSRKIIKKSCEYFQNKNINFSINLSLEDIKNDLTVNYLFKNIKKTNTQNYITLEIVESEGIETYKEVNTFLQKAKELGCKIGIDDFGTGYSNYEYLTKLDIDILKIDGSLIKNIHKERNIYLIVKNIVDFAKILNIKVVAEFVHNKEVQNIIEELKIEYSQGYFFHEPEKLA